MVQDGVICTRKQFPQRRSSNPLRQFRSELGFWVEAAALLRLQGLPYVPRVVRIEPENTAITMEYIRGENLRTILQVRSNDRKYESLEHTFVEALEKAGPAIASKVGRMLLGLLQRGVAPRDVNAANFILARSSGRLYVVDFHLSWLRPVLPFHREAEAINEIVRTISVGSLRV